MNPPEPSPPAPSGGGAPAPPVDVEKLAEKVYRLMLAEVRLELARQGGTAGRR
jgi:hypothetical protein